MNQYTGPLLFFPIVYGTILVKLFGFSFSLLRISTIFLTFLLTIGIFLFIRKKTNNPALSLLAALVIWLNPIVYNLSFTFMTDVPALLLLLLAIVCFTAGQEKNDWRFLLLGSLATVIGFYTRQTNIFILVAFGLYALFDSQLRNIKNIIVLSIPALIGMIIYWFLYQNQFLPNGSTLHSILGKRALAEHAFLWFWYTILYLGLFTLPLTISVLKNNWRDKKYLLAAVLGLLIPIILFFSRHELFPYVPNMINHFGLGPMADVLQGNFIALFSKSIWLIISLFSGLGAGLLVFILWQIKISRVNRWLCLLCVLFLLPILFLSSFDRYFLPLLLIIIIILADQLKNIKLNWLLFFIIGALAIFSISQTYFYLNWNQSRAELNQTAINLSQTMPQYTGVDGGYEWTGWLGYWEAQKIGLKRGSNNSPWWIKFLMTNNSAEYVVSASPLADYSVIIQKIVPGWNPNNHLFLLKRNQWYT